MADYLYVPVNFNLKQLLSDYPTDKVTYNDRYKIYYLLHTIIDTSFRTRNNVTEDGFIRLKAQYLQIVVRKYNVYLQYLADTYVIDVDRQYVIGEKPRGYKLATGYWGQPLKPIDISLNRILSAITIVENSIAEHAMHKYPYLTKWLENGGLEINMVVVSNYLTSLANYNSAIKKARLDHLKLKTNKSKEDRDAIRKCLAPEPNHQIGAYLIHHKQFRASIDNTAGRLHTNLTNLKSELRQAFTYKGKPLVSLDLSNSQPYLSTVLLTAEFWSELKIDGSGLELLIKSIHSKGDVGVLATSQIDTEQCRSRGDVEDSSSRRVSPSINIYQFKKEVVDPIVGITSHITGSAALIMIVIYDNVADKEDVKSYCRYVASGQFYEFLASAISEKGYPVPGSRKELKGMVFQVMFTSNKFMGQENAEPKRIFSSIFPTVSKIFNRIKSVESNVLPILLQSIESHLFLDIIAKRISLEYPNLPIYTIHDSIIILKEYQPQVLQIMQEELTNAIGLTPTIKVEDLSINNLIDLTAKMDKDIVEMDRNND